MMLKISGGPSSSSSRLGVVVATAMTCVVAVCAGLATAGSAFADHAGGEPPTLNGDWAPMNRCPVDNPVMLAADNLGEFIACISDISPKGSLKIGNLTVAIGGSNHQFEVALGETTAEMASPVGGVLRDEPVQLPGGLQELLCPGSGHTVVEICRHVHDGGWDHHFDVVTLTLESAGDITNFSLFAGIAAGVPIGTVPVKIHIQNELLGHECYIGTDAAPIVYEPMNLTAPTVSFEHFAGDGTPTPTVKLKEALLDRIEGSNASQVASGFGVPAVSGCGYYNQAIDNKIGLPSPAGGENSITFAEITGYLVAFVHEIPNEGQDLAKYWHSAVIPPEGHHHGH